jgi:hypothetical protein
LTLAEAAANVGRAVEYRPFNRSGVVVDSGIITSTNEAFVFVRYGLDWGSKATMPEDLELRRTAFLAAQVVLLAVLVSR